MIEFFFRIKSKLIKINWILTSQFGLNFLMFINALRRMPLYLSEKNFFRKNFSGKMKFMPCLHDRYKEGGETKSEYFWQDLLVARYIFEANPLKHVDIGSRVDGFIAHVASFREIEVFDVRPIRTIIPGIVFKQADFMNLNSLSVNKKNYCDSLSCLHAIEHFGLGRYGDPVNPQGYKHGISNMAKLLKSGGTLYLSTPIGQERVEFNANWVFDPQRILKCAKAAGLILKKLIIISPESGPHESEINDFTLTEIASKSYQLGLFIFIRK